MNQFFQKGKTKWLIFIKKNILVSNKLPKTSKLKCILTEEALYVIPDKQELDYCY